jgi:tetrathionate reductase subunit B
LKVLIIDNTKCNGCYNCQIACKDEHVGNDWTPYAGPQPDTGQFWTKVIETVRGTVPKVKVTYEHSICQHCKEAPCISACANKAIYRREDGIVIIDPEKCSGHRNCVYACPYKVIYFNDDLNLAQKCTFCAHLLDRGWKEPRCVEVCPTGALTFGEEDELKELIGKAQVMNPEFGTKPNVYYIGIPGRFVAGAAYDREADRCLPGATVTLTDSKSGDSRSETTDNFGDFWFKDLKMGDYSLTVKKTGYRNASLKTINTRQDVNLGDIPMKKASGT